VEIIPDPKVLLVQAFGFLLVLVVLAKFLFKPIMDILDARRAEIDNRYASAEAQRKTAEELKADYEKRLAAIDEEMRAKITDAIKQGQAMRDEIITQGRAGADQILTKAQQEITREKDIALAELKSKIADFTVMAAGKLIEEDLDDPKHRKLVDQFINELDEVAK